MATSSSAPTVADDDDACFALDKYPMQKLGFYEREEGTQNFMTYVWVDWTKQGV